MINLLTTRRWPLRLPFTRSLTTTLRTLPAATPTSISSHFQTHPASPESTTLYLIHPHLPNLSEIIRSLQIHSTNSVGSFISTANPNPSLHILTITPTVNERINIFRSNILGPPPPSVGKYRRSHVDSGRKEGIQGEEVGDIHRALEGNGSDGEMDWSGLWGSSSNLKEEIPDGLKGLSDVKSILILSDSTPEPLLSIVTRTYPTASILGLLTPPTPFITGRPHTLIHNTEIYSEGAIGIVISSSTSSSTSTSTPNEKDEKIEVGIVYDGLESLGDILVVDRAQGNLLISCQSPNDNPTRTLLKYIQQYKSQSTQSEVSSLLDSTTPPTTKPGTSFLTGKSEKDDVYYLAFLGSQGNDDNDIHNNGDEQNKSIHRIVKILSGDPSRGVLGLDMEESLKRGMRVQFMHRTKSHNISSKIEADLMFMVVDERSEMDVDVGAVEGGGIKVVTTEGLIVKSHVDGDGDEDGVGRQVGVCKVVGSSGWMRLR